MNSFGGAPATVRGEQARYPASRLSSWCWSLVSLLLIALASIASTAASAQAAPFPVGGDSQLPGPEIAVDDGHTGHIVWPDGSDRLRYCRLPRGAGECSPSLTFSPPESDFWGPRVVIGAGRVFLLTDRCCFPEDRLLVYQSTDGGSTFTGPTTIAEASPGTNLAPGTGEAAFGPGFRISTTGVKDGTFYRAAPIEPAGAPISRLATLGSGGESSIGFLDSVTPIVAFERDGGTYFRVWGGSGDYNETSSWGPIRSAGPGEEPKLASGPRGTYLLELIGDRYKQSYAVRRWDPATSGFPGEPAAITPRGSPMFGDFVEDGGGNLHAIWIDGSVDPSPVLYQRSTDGRNWRDKPRELGGKDPFDLDVGASSDGGGWAVWRNFGTGKVMAAPFGPVSTGGGDAGVKRTRFERQVARLQRRAQDRWPRSFAGLWADRRRVLIAFTRRSRARVRRLRSDFARPKRLRPRTARRSLRSLTRLQARMGEDRKRGLFDFRYDIGLNLQRNLVIATVESRSPEIVAAFRKRYGDAALVREGPLASGYACTRASCAPDLRSGLRVGLTTPDGGNKICSTAFAARARRLANLLLSAAHCGGADVGAPRRHPSTSSTYGYVRREKRSGRVDAELHQLVGPFRARPVIYVNDQLKAAPVNRKPGRWEWIVEGLTKACKAGATTNDSCGVVEDKYFMPNNIPNSERFVRASTCAQPGDSGAGVYSLFQNRKDRRIRYRAIGILSGGSVVKDSSGGSVALSCADERFYSYFGHIEYAQHAFGLSSRLHRAPARENR
jgi:hypothetical protein